MLEVLGVLAEELHGGAAVDDGVRGADFETGFAFAFVVDAGGAGAVGWVDLAGS